MKRIFILKDNVVTLLITLLLFFIIAISYFFSLQLEYEFSNYGMDLNPIPIFIIFSVIEVVLYFVILTRITTIITFKESKMSTGLIGFKNIKYSEIVKVKGKGQITLIGKNNVINLKILSAEKNETKYNKILTELETKTGKSFNIKSVLKSIVDEDKNKYTMPNGNKLSVNGILMVLTIYIAFGSLSYISVLKNQITGDLNIVKIILSTVLLIMSILTTIFVFSKNKKAKLLMKIYFLISFIAANITNLYFAVIENNAIALSAINLAMGITIVVMLFYYLNTSRRVKATF